METAAERTRRRGNVALPEFCGFPPEITTEVFLRLPAKSIGQFRCISKPFRSMLSDSMFIRRHLEHNVHQKKLLLSLHNLYSFDLSSVGEGVRDLALVELTCPLLDDSVSNPERAEFERDHVEIIGSGNGLMCIFPSYHSAFVYNPTTRDSKRVPDSIRIRLPNDEQIIPKPVSFGFGYDTVSDDYKVVKFIFSDEGPTSASVYSLKTDSWRQISGLPYEICSVSGVHLNGAIHWFAILHNGAKLVAVFDLEKEEFRDFHLPEEAVGHPYLNIGVLKGQLCLIQGGFDMHNFIWVMKEYGVERSWSKINISYRTMTPLWSTKNDEDEVLLELDGCLVLYNFKCNTQRVLEFSDVEFPRRFEASTYVESLVSPNSYGSG